MRRTVALGLALLAVVGAGGGCLRARVSSSYGDEDSKREDVSPGAVFTWNFDGDSAGGPASGFVPFLGAWSILREASSPSQPHVYAQTAKRFELAGTIVSTKVFGDFEATVKCKMFSGLVEGTGGMMFRFQNPKTYYVAYLNVLEGEFGLCRYVAGNRQPVKATEVKAAKEAWHALRVECQGEDVRCTLNGEVSIEVKDPKPMKGKIGLWSRSDSVVYFDNLEVVAK